MFQQRGGVLQDRPTLDVKSIIYWLRQGMLRLESRLEKYIPVSVKPALQRLYKVINDAVDALVGREEMVPPWSMTRTEALEYIRSGEQMKDYFVRFGGLGPKDCVLDVGCGTGRLALPLTKLMSSDGEYRGFDTKVDGITWCRKNITSSYPNFQFQHCPVYNSHYNADGGLSAARFRFPYEEAYFDFVFLYSVFTHMLPPDLENYISEIARVLKPGGTCFSSFFLVNEESARLIQSGSSGQAFVHRIEGCLTTNKADPESALAYEEETVRELFQKSSFRVESPYYGSCCGRAQFISYQDFVVARKSVTKILS